LRHHEIEQVGRLPMFVGASPETFESSRARHSFDASRAGVAPLAESAGADSVYDWETPVLRAPSPAISRAPITASSAASTTSDRAPQRRGPTSLSSADESGPVAHLRYEKRTPAFALCMKPRNLSRSFVTVRRYGVQARDSLATLANIPPLTAYATPGPLTGTTRRAEMADAAISLARAARSNTL
jgi:hypothetical protein